RADFHNARQLLRALDRRLAKQASRAPRSSDPGELFLANRGERARRAEILGGILIPLGPDYSIALRRAPDVRAACEHAYGPPGERDPEEAAAGETLVSLPELLGVISAYEW